MNRRKQEALILLTVILSFVLVTYLVAIKKHSSFSLQSRSWDQYVEDQFYSYSGVLSYSGSVIYPSPTPEVDPTCQALQQLASSTGACRPNDRCNGVHCTVSQLGTFDLTVEPCHDPPAVDVVGRDISGRVLFNETITQSRQEDLNGLGTLKVNVAQSPSEDSITISVTAHLLGGIIVPLIPETTIPLNRQQCAFVSHTPPSPQPTPTPSYTPTPTPGVDPTCQSLQQLADAYPVCSTSQHCSGLHCTMASYGSFDLTVEPCHNPPAVDVVGRDSSGTVVFNDTLTDSRQEDLGLGTVLNITIKHPADDDSLLISVSYIVPGLSLTVPIIPETRIPLNREQCGFTPRPPTSSVTAKLLQPSTSTRPHISPPQSTPMYTRPVAHTVTENSSVVTTPSTKPPAGGHVSLTVAVAVPVTVIFCLLGSVVLVVAIVIVIRRHKRLRREYHFQRMTFDNDRDDDDDDEDL